MIKYGGDYLAGNRYSNAVLSAHKPGDVGGIFLDTFGYALSIVEKWCRSGKFSEIVVHIAPFDRSHAYPISKLRTKVIQETKKLEAISKKYPKTILMLSPFCEHNHKARDIKPLLDNMGKVAPSCLIVNSIWKGEQVPGYITEIHLPNTRLVKKPQGEYTVSFDGFGGNGEGDFPDSDIQSILDYYSDARHIRAWNFRYNGKYGHNDPTPINQRKHWPTVKDIKGTQAIMKRREGAITWPRNALYKPFADDHGNEAPTKDRKALCILPKGGESAQVLDSNSKVIDTLVRVKPDHEMGRRYYSKFYAFELGDLAQANTGRRVISVKSGSVVMPLTDADLRSGIFK